MIKQRWTSLRLQAKLYSDSLNCIMLVETTRVTRPPTIKKLRGYGPETSSRLMSHSSLHCQVAEKRSSKSDEQRILCSQHALRLLLSSATNEVSTVQCISLGYRNKWMYSPSLSSILKKKRWTLYSVWHGIQTPIRKCRYTARYCIVIGPICGLVWMWVRLWVCYHDNSKLRASILTKLGLWVKLVTISSWLRTVWPFRAPGKGVCGGANIFASALLQPCAQCLRLLRALFHFIMYYINKLLFQTL